MVIFHSYVSLPEGSASWFPVSVCHHMSSRTPGPQDPGGTICENHATQTHSCIANFHRKQLTDVDEENHADEGEDKAITFRIFWFLDVLVVNLSCFQLRQNRRSSWPGWKLNTLFWVNYNISLTWIKAIWGWFPLLTIIPSEVAVRSL